jgi:DNA mismatch endonuclease (patch repair protein)
MPKTRREFWSEKFERNVARDAAAAAALGKLGWRVEVIWECQVKDERHMSRLASRIVRRGGRLTARRTVEL